MSKLRLLLSVAALAWIAGPAAYAAWPPLYDGAPIAVPVATKPVALDSRDPARTRVGRLSYLGGVVLAAGDRRFGGLSDMLWEPACESFLVVSDTGLWVTLKPVEKNDLLVGIEQVFMAPIRDEKGAPPARKRDADAEALARLDDGSLLVWFEQEHRAQRYDGVSACDPESLKQPAHDIFTYAEMTDWPKNGGAEASIGRGGHILLLSEAADVGDGGRDALHIVPGHDGASRVTRFVYRPPEGYNPTAMAVLRPDDPNSPVLVLHRHFSLLRGVGAILSVTEIGSPPAALVEATEIARLVPTLTVDNMEAVAVRMHAGRTFIYLLSDDNFNPMQKTILLKFELVAQDD